MGTVHSANVRISHWVNVIACAYLLVVVDTYDAWYEGCDLFEVAHPEHPGLRAERPRPAHRQRGADPPAGRTAVRRPEPQVRALDQVVASMAGFGKGTRGINSDFGFHRFAGV